MTSIECLILGAADPGAAERFYETAFGLGPLLRVRASDAQTSGFRGFTVSLIMTQPADVDSMVTSAVTTGATIMKPVKKSLWGYGGVVQAPDGAIWKVATSAKKNSGPVSRTVDQIVLLLAANDVGSSKDFYTGRGIAVGKTFGKYVEFSMPDSAIGLGLYGRRALAKDAGLAPEGDGSHRLVIGNDDVPFTDPDGFVWETVSA